MWEKPTYYTCSLVFLSATGLPRFRRIAEAIFRNRDSGGLTPASPHADRSQCRRRRGDACPTTGFPVAGQLNRMGRRFKRHRPSGYPCFLYPHTLHSQLSPASFTALTHSTSAFLPPLHRVLALRKTGFVNRFIKLCIPLTEVRGTDAWAPHAARVLSRFKERCPKALNSL